MYGIILAAGKGAWNNAPASPPGREMAALDIEVSLKIMKQRIQAFLRRFSFRTGVIILLLCVPCYIISFAQMALPISAAAKGALWFIFFGLAKTFQYGGLTILGVEGIRRIKDWWGSKKN